MNDSTTSCQGQGPSPEKDSRTGSPNAPLGRGVDGVSAEEQPTVISNRPPLPTFPAPEPLARPVPADVPGARLEHFELLEYVGGGGMGRVFRALDTRLGRTVAAKVLPRQQASDIDTLMRFRNEARSAARLNHPGIAQVYYVGEADGFPFIAFEFVEGMNIRDLVNQKGPLSLAEALNYTLQVAEALDHAASRNVVHRDIKPSNVLINSEGRAKLIDMGLARMHKLSPSAHELTASGVTLGTFDYISPEQARDPRLADARSDIYSLGCTLFFMLTGQPPFPEGTVLQKLLQHQEIDPPDVHQLRPDLPEEVSRLLRRMMAKDPHRRYPDARRLIDALKLLADRVGLRPTGPGEIAWAPAAESRASFFRRHIPWMAPVAALLVAVALLNLHWSSSGENEPSRPAWPAAPEEYLADLPRPESPVPAASGMESKPLPVKPASGPDHGTAAMPLGAPMTQPRETATGTAGAASPGPPAAGARLAPTTSDAASAGIAHPNPLGTLVARKTGSTGLMPELREGGVSIPSPTQAGLLARPRAEPVSLALDGGTATVFRPTDGGPADPIPKPEAGALIVEPGATGDRTFATLGAACAAAKSGDVIELRFDGRIEEEPLELANLELTIRAAEGFQPTVGFRPAEIDPIGYPRSMITLIGSGLTLSGVTIEFDLSRELSGDRWSLFEVGPGEKVRLSQCWLTIRNAAEGRAAYHQEVAFFRLKSVPAAGVALADVRSQEIRPVAIELADTVARGEAVLIWIEKPQPASLDWQGGALITSEQLLVAEGGEMSPLPGEAVQIGLERLLAVADRGLCRLKHGEFAPHQLPLRVEAANSVFLLAAEASLIEQVGVTVMEQSRERIGWMADHNVYQNVARFWTIRHLDPGMSVEQWTFDDWQAHWTSTGEKSPTLMEIEPSRLPTPERPVHSLTPDDYGGAEKAAGA